jgi:hypothetical protein
MGLLKFVVIKAGRPFMIRVENTRSFISASDCGVTLLLNKASTDNGTDGSGVSEGVGKIAGVAASIKLVGLFSGVFAGTRI